MAQKRTVKSHPNDHMENFEHLGEMLHRYKPVWGDAGSPVWGGAGSLVQLGILYILLFSILFFGTTGLSPDLSVEKKLSFLLYAIPLLMPGIGLLVFGLLQLQYEIRLYKQGMVERLGKWVHSARYEELKIWRRTTRVSHISGTLIGIRHIYWIQFPGGLRRPFFWDYGRSKTGELLSNLICQALLPQATAAFNQGQDVVFGEVLLNQEGLKMGRQTFLWSEGYHVHLAQGVFTIMTTQARRRRKTIEFAKVPNAFVLLNLLQSIGRFSQP